jgi:GPI mannosyltransferase 3
MREQKGGGGGGHDEKNSSSAATTPARLFTTRSAVLVFLLCCCIRIFHATVMIHSYFDPDEFWQTMEPAYCLVFYNPQQEEQGVFGEAAANNVHSKCPGFTWEWKRRPAADSVQDANLIQSSLWGPARTHLSVLPVYWLYVVLKYFAWDSTFMVERGPMILYAITVAAPTDWVVWYIAHYLQRSSPSKTALPSYYSSSSLPAWCLFCSLSSWFNAYAMVRTFANAQETALFMFAVALVIPELLDCTSNQNQRSSSKGNHDNTSSDDDDDSARCANLDNTATSLRRACLAFWLGGLCVSIRSTAIAAFVPMGILLALHQYSSSSSSSCLAGCYSFALYLVFPCATFGLAGIVVAMCVDWYFFGFWTMPFLGNFHFNAVLDHAALFGSHPWHWYISAGIPVVAGLWWPFLIADIVVYWKGTRPLLFRGNGRRHDVGRRNLSILAIAYVVILSANAHKEFRYILPVLPLFCLLAGERVRLWFLWMTGVGGVDHVNSQRSRGRVVMLGTIVVLIQLAVVAYFGRFHQSGSVAVNRRIVQDVLHENDVNNDSVPSFSIHYLTGACHSTPLLSQLHIPTRPFLTSSSSNVTRQQRHQQQHVRFDTWSLDCSPDCRADPNAICEYQRFDLDPFAFIKEAYDSTNHNHHRLNVGGTAGTGSEDVVSENESSDSDENTMTCTMEQQQQQHAQEERNGISPPDYLVTTSSYVNRIGLDLLHERYGLDKLEQFPQRILGIRLAGHYTLFDEPGNSFAPSFHSIYTLKVPFGQESDTTVIELSVEDMIVFHRTRQQQIVESS